MKKETSLAALGYFMSVAILLSFLYWFLKNEGFTESNFIIASVFVLLLAGGWGIILSIHLLAPKVKLDENLSQLTSEILHELNIPLSTMKANSTLLKKRIKDEKSLQRLQRIEDASLRLERLYKELVYSIKKEIHPIEKETFSLQEVLQERIEVFQSFERNHFSINKTNKMLYADKIGFEKVLDNLLMNAMKYSDKDSTIKIRMHENILSIMDQGIGMDETQLLRVYERYYQGDGNKEGKGIGLALVKSYCDAEDIEIQIDSQKDKGTTIMLTLDKTFKR